MPYSLDILLFLPELFMLSFVCFILIVPLLINKYYYWNNASPDISLGTQTLVFLILYATAILLLNMFTDDFFVFNFQLNNYYGLTITKILIILFTFLVLDTMPKNLQYELYVILAICLFALFVLVNAQDFLTFYLALELQSFGFYILTASKRTSSFSIEAAVKYFVLGAISSGFLLLGISLLYGYFGTINFNDLQILFISEPDFIFFLGLTLILIGFFF
jgi:NADH-quinone oxidoreductase subunit N